MISSLFRTRALPLLIVGWLGTIALGLGALGHYAATPAPSGQAPLAWPDKAPGGLTLAGDALTIVLAVHPRCPCTRASISELERSVAQAPTPARVYALVFEPEPALNDQGFADSGSDRFARTRIVERLSRVPGVEIIADPGSRIAGRFGAMTSGHAVVYDQGGALRYSGGLTPTRAHEGPNTGSASIRNLIHGSEALAPRAPVYGCPLCPDTPDASAFTTPDACPEEDQT